MVSEINLALTERALKVASSSRQHSHCASKAGEGLLTTQPKYDARSANSIRQMRYAVEGSLAATSRSVLRSSLVGRRPSASTSVAIDAAFRSCVSFS